MTEIFSPVLKLCFCLCLVTNYIVNLIGHHFRPRFNAEACIGASWILKINQVGLSTTQWDQGNSLLLAYVLGLKSIFTSVASFMPPAKFFRPGLFEVLKCTALMCLLLCLMSRETICPYQNMGLWLNRFLLAEVPLSMLCFLMIWGWCYL